MTKQRVTRRKRRQPSDRAPAGLYGTRPRAGAANSSGSSEVQIRPPGSTGPVRGDGSSSCTCNIIFAPGSSLDEHAEGCPYRIYCEGIAEVRGDVPRTHARDKLIRATCPYGVPSSTGCVYPKCERWCVGRYPEDLAQPGPPSADGSPILGPIPDISTSDRYKPGVLGPSPATDQPVDVDGTLSPGPDDLLQRLDRMSVLGSCTCMTKQKRPSAHGMGCPYRVMREAAVEIRVLRPKSERGFPLPIPDPADLQRRLHMVTEGSCSCHKRGTPAEVAGHRPLCRYRLLKEAEEVIWLFIPEVGR